jgi:hypothetical protein
MKDRSKVNPDEFDVRLRLTAYRHTISTGGVPTVREMARKLGASVRQVHAGLLRLSASHAFMLQEDGELWRVAPFSAVSTAFPVRIGRRSWFGNCIWDALGIPAMLGGDAWIGASCGCCNAEMPVLVKRGRLVEGQGIIHIAVPAREWYNDVVFT